MNLSRYVQNREWNNPSYNTAIAMQIENIKHHLDAIDTLSEAQFELWRPLTGRNTLEEYRKLLHFAAESESLPTTLVAVENATVLGSVNVLENDLPLRPDIAPWLAQLYVFPNFRGRGAGALLIAGAIAEARKLNRSILYLYTSETLPSYYEKLGWSRMEEIAYLGKRRVIMAYEID